MLVWFNFWCRVTSWVLDSSPSLGQVLGPSPSSVARVPIPILVPGLDSSLGLCPGVSSGLGPSRGSSLDLGLVFYLGLCSSLGLGPGPGPGPRPSSFQF